ncbi:hypothetical protein PTT_18003 [Pyrenophora teres f. teres 0-1]|uniref:Uncharacterized protein n=1 Tax=Pyrenophora teres f. teres (strain 0-1) TaxID=861557 RepID=E3S5R2_PYRTT|nr:hypothetical protein PTT_18003 [Pyrenophora teres f. teres 0-1]
MVRKLRPDGLDHHRRPSRLAVTPQACKFATVETRKSMPAACSEPTVPHNNVSCDCDAVGVSHKAVARPRCVPVAAECRRRPVPTSTVKACREGCKRPAKPLRLIGMQPNRKEKSRESLDRCYYESAWAMSSGMLAGIAE